MCSRLALGEFGFLSLSSGASGFRVRRGLAFRGSGYRMQGID